MAEELQVRIAEPTEEDEILAFYRTNQKASNLFEVLWPWQKNAPYYHGKESFAVARYHDDIIGSILVIPVSLTLSGQDIQAAWQQNSLVASAARGKGVGRKLVEAGAKAWDIILAKGSSDAMYRLRKSAGFSDVCRSNLFVRVLRARESYASIQTRFAETFFRVWGRLISPSSRLRDVTIKLDTFGSEFDTLMLHLSQEPVLRLRKGQAYLNWRYFQCPKKAYTVLGSNRPGAVGATVLSWSGEDTGDAWIVDMLCDWSDKQTAGDLVQGGLRYANNNSAKRLWAFSTFPAAQRCLIRHGFVPVAQSRRFTIRARPSIILPVPLVADFWHGDGDVELYT